MNTYINSKCKSLRPNTPYIGIVVADTPELAATILYKKNLEYGIVERPKAEDMELMGGAYVLSGGDSKGYSKDTKNVPNYSIEQLLEKVHFWVEADGFAQHCLWEDYGQNSPCQGAENLDFHIGGYGVGFLTDTIYNTNIRTTVMVRPFLLNDVLCAFYEATSEVVSWRKVEQFLRANAKKYVNNNCNATNFHLCIQRTEDISSK